MQQMQKTPRSSCQLMQSGVIGVAHPGLMLKLQGLQRAQCEPVKQLHQPTGQNQTYVIVCVHTSQLA